MKFLKVNDPEQEDYVLSELEDPDSEIYRACRYKEWKNEHEIFRQVQSFHEEITMTICLCILSQLVEGGYLAMTEGHFVIFEQ